MSGQSGDATANLLNTPDTTERGKRSEESADEADFRALGDMKGKSVTQGFWLGNVHRLKQLESACSSWREGVGMWLPVHVYNILCFWICNSIKS